MEVKTVATAKCTLKQFIGADPLRPGHALSGYDRDVLEHFVGKPGDLSLAINHLQFDTFRKLSRLCPSLGQITFTHSELLLRFSRMGQETQAVFMIEACKFLWEKSLDLLEVEVQWSPGKIRVMKIERIEQRDSIDKPCMEMRFSLI